MDANILGDADQARTLQLLDLIRAEEFRLVQVIQHLYPEKPIRVGADHFRTFKSRFNDKARNVPGALRLETDPPESRTPIRRKTLVLSSVQDPLDAGLDAMAEAPWLRSDHRHYQPSAFEPLRVSTSGGRTFAKYVERVLHAHWSTYDKEAQDMLCGICARLRPITVVGAPNALWGFALTPMGAGGIAMDGLLDHAQRVGLPADHLHLAALAVLLRTADDLYGWACRNGIEPGLKLKSVVPLHPKAPIGEELMSVLEPFVMRATGLVLELEGPFSEERLEQVSSMLQTMPALRFCVGHGWARAASVDETMSAALRIISAPYESIEASMGAGHRDTDHVLARLAEVGRDGAATLVSEVTEPATLRILKNRKKEALGDATDLLVHGKAVVELDNAWADELSLSDPPGAYVLQSTEDASVLARVVSACRDFGTSVEIEEQTSDASKLVLRAPDRRVRLTVFESLAGFGPGAVALAVGPYPDPARNVIGVADFPKRLPGLLALEEAVHRLADDVGSEHATYKDALFEPPRVKPATGQAQDALSFLSQWLDDPDAPFMAVSGEYGAGKTFLARMLCRRLYREAQEASSVVAGASVRLPFYLDMRLMPTYVNGQVPTVEEMIDSVMTEQGMPDVTADLVLGLLRSGSALLVFDGVDEKAVHMRISEAHRLLAQIQACARRTTRPAGDGTVANEDAPCPKVLVLCRDHYFRSRKHELEMTGGQRSELAPRTCTVLPFDELQVQACLGRLLTAEDAADAWDLCRRLYDLADLACRPYLLQLIAGQLSELKRLGESRPGGRVSAATLYNVMIENWLLRDDGKHVIPVLVKPLLMEGLAVSLFAKGRTLAAAKDGERSAIDVDALEAWVLANLPSHLRGWNLSELHVFLQKAFTDVRAATFLVRAGQRGFRFAHTSIGELFLARAIFRGLQSAHSGALALPALNAEVVSFVIDLLVEWEEGAADVSAAIRSVLVGGAGPPKLKAGHGDSGAATAANALRIAMAWRRSGRAGAPRLTDARLGGAELLGCQFRRINLARATLVNAVLADTCWEDVDLAGADLRGADLRGATLTRVRLAGANLDGALLSRCRFFDVDAQQVSAVGVDAAAIQVRGGSFSGSSLTSANLRHALFSDVDCGAMDLTGSDVRSMVGVGLQTGRITGVKLTEVTPEQPHVLPAHPREIECAAACSASRSVATVGRDKRIRIWDADTGRIKQVHAIESSSVAAVVLEGQGRFLAAADWDVISIWDLDRGALHSRLTGHAGRINALAASGDGRLLSGGDDGVICLWRIGQLRPLEKARTSGQRILSLAFMPLGDRFVAGLSGGDLVLFDVESMKVRWKCRADIDRVRGVAAVADNRALSFGTDAEVSVWCTQTHRYVDSFRHHNAPISSVAVIGRGKEVVSTAVDGSLRAWNLDTAEISQDLRGRPGPQVTAGFGDGRLVLWRGETGAYGVWDSVTGRRQYSLDSDRADVTHLSVFGDGQCVLSASSDGHIIRWFDPDGRLMMHFPRHDGPITAMAAGDRLVATAGADGVVQLADTKSGELRHSLTEHGGTVTALALPTDGTMVSAGEDGVLRVWDAQDGTLHARLGAPRGRATIALASVSGGRFVAAADGRGLVTVWDPALRHVICAYDLKPQLVRQLVPLGDDGLLICTSHELIVCQSVAEGGSRRSLRLPHHPGASIAALHGGQTLVTGGDDGVLRFWRMEQLDSHVAIPAHDGRIVTLAADGLGRIATGGAQGEIRLWDFADRADLFNTGLRDGQHVADWTAFLFGREDAAVFRRRQLAEHTPGAAVRSLFARCGGVQVPLDVLEQREGQTVFLVTTPDKN